MIWPIETKDLAVARTPAELSNELQGSFGSGRTKPSHAEKHLERSQWVRQHISGTLAYFGLDTKTAASWQVRPLIVVSHELMGPFIAPGAIEVVAFRDLTAILAAGKTRRR